MNIKNYVLGNKDNQMLLDYWSQYEAVIKKRFGEIQKYYSNLGIENIKNFTHPEVSSIVNYIYYSYFLPKKKFDENLEAIFHKMFSIKEKQEDCISGTNILLTLDDNNPYNAFDAHPDHITTGGVLGYGVKAVHEWRDVFQRSFSLLKDLSPGFFWEVNFLIKKIIPLGTAVGVHNSASYKECIGHLYLGFTIDSVKPEINIIESIIHEYSHNKLNLLFQFDPILLNTKEEKYYSAIRPDARHLHGVFIGYHAFAPTMYILMKAYVEGKIGDEHIWIDKLTLYYLKTKFLQKIIKKHAKLTVLGLEISQEIDYVISLMDDLFQKMNPTKEILENAIIEQKKHFSEVNTKYKNLQY